ncbi:metallophosphoesterase family protein [Aspergillus mulundensis]|uniref:Calcineurin-like phosphoesterase domain-containing protein n=1 Tax=Aspergillus mulundensis TaxID=1810919 RepID=A0A3D8SL88_9EURO|nr:Uncharacterized protein DSM5745_03715 [Aspergillus mulundensis]RDW87073.1 Uncharacterized protein DSM5745_03715 [Aspergillus mulundensis]
MLAQTALAGATSFRPLRFSDDGTFQISIFKDLHFGKSKDLVSYNNDRNSITVLNTILNAESPDLVVLNGDLITGENGFLENATVYIDQIIGPLVDRGLTWASMYGNHDHQYNLSAEALLEREQSYANARTQRMVSGHDAGVSNYYLPVYGSDGSSDPKLLLWFFDSRGGNYFRELDKSGNIVPQPNWYNKTIPLLAFVHIPTNASLAAQTVVGIDANSKPGINNNVPLAQQGQGWCEDGTNSNDCAYGGQDIPFIKALVKTPGVLGVFSGHDHGNTWCYKWDSELQLPGVGGGNGLNLCFGQHSGYGGYGSWIRGSRQLLLSEEALGRGELDTWIRLESGDVVGSVSLNGTYGEDLYPATPNDMTHS